MYNKRSFYDIIIQAVAVVAFVAICIFSVALISKRVIESYDAILLDVTCLAVVVAIISSQTYSFIPDPEMPEIWNSAERLQVVWVHSNFSWLSVNVWMKLTPMYCTCIAIYLSGNKCGWDKILFYSILSLLISLSDYVVRPSNRAAGFRRAYREIATALAKYKGAKATSNFPDPQILVDAIIKGEGFIAEQDLIDPQ